MILIQILNYDNFVFYDFKNALNDFILGFVWSVQCEPGALL